MSYKDKIPKSEWETCEVDELIDEIDAENEMNELAQAIEESEVAELVELEENENWTWFDVKITDPDVVFASEVIASYAKEYGFHFCAIDENGVLRFNRKEGDNE